MRIYLAARYSRIEELNRYKADLERLGHVVTSRWLNGNHQINDDGLSAEASRSLRERFANEDYDDVMSAAMTISFTEEPRSTNSRGGRHVEFGLAVADSQIVYVVGPRENVFHCLPFLSVYPDWSSCLADIEKLWP